MSDDLAEEEDARIAAEIRRLWALPGMDDPAWVNAELERHQMRPFVQGEMLSFADPVQLTVALNIPRWAILGGFTGGEDDAPTVEQINLGRLVALLYDGNR